MLVFISASHFVSLTLCHLLPFYICFRASSISPLIIHNELNHYQLRPCSLAIIVTSSNVRTVWKGVTHAIVVLRFLLQSQYSLLASARQHAPATHPTLAVAPKLWTYIPWPLPLTPLSLLGRLILRDISDATRMLEATWPSTITTHTTSHQ